MKFRHSPGFWKKQLAAGQMPTPLRNPETPLGLTTCGTTSRRVAGLEVPGGSGGSGGGAAPMSQFPAPSAATNTSPGQRGRGALLSGSRITPARQHASTPAISKEGSFTINISLVRFHLISAHLGFSLGSSITSRCPIRLDICVSRAPRSMFHVPR